VARRTGLSLAEVAHVEGAAPASMLGRHDGGWIRRSSSGPPITGHS
jgi:hypothetical protein